MSSIACQFKDLLPNLPLYGSRKKKMVGFSVFLEGGSDLFFISGKQMTKV